MRHRGCCTAAVETEKGRCYPVVFMSPARAAQELHDNTVLGEPWLAEPGLIILPEVTVCAINDVVDHLWRHGYFARLSPTGG